MNMVHVLRLLRLLGHALSGALGCALLAAGPATVAAAATATPPVTVRYMLWDSGQLPAYRQCAAAFEQQHPDIRIKFQQAGWGDYWTALSTGFIAGVAPDVFTNHLAKAPDFVANGLLEDLGPYIRRDGVDLTQYPPALVAGWARDGHQYALPKDWDTVALVVNLAHARQAGVSLDELQHLDWNPRDGGSFERVMRRLTLDRQGRNALDPQFDRRAVARYGYMTPGAGGMAGQIEWSHFAVSNGFRFQDAPWALPYHYDDPRLAETLSWLAGLPAKGIAVPYQGGTGLGTSARFAAGQVAMVPDGAWMIGHFARLKGVESAWVPLPVGPGGQRASMLNGLGDSMWVGSRVKPQAWQWIRYLGSRACQQTVARTGVVLPAVNGLAEEVIAQHRAQGVDASAFLTMARARTFPMPIAANGAQVDALINGAIESVLMGREAAAPALAEANRQANALFRLPGGRAVP